MKTNQVKQQIQIKQYTLDKRELIGKGQYGLVYKAFYEEEVYCAKVLKKKGIDTKYIEREEEFLNQLKNLPFQNPNIVHTFDVMEQDDQIFIIMEYCKGGDLKMEMKKKQKAGIWYTQQEIINIIAQIIRGYKTLYDLNFLHRDIKPANILINSGFYKLSDFGLGRYINNNQMSNLGTPAYTAPDIFFTKNYDSKCDVYSLGVMFYELIYQQLPLQAKSTQELIAQLKNSKEIEIKCPQKDGVDIKIKVLIEQMLRYDSNIRIGWNELLNHQLFNGQQINHHHIRRNSTALLNQQSFKYQKQLITPYYHFSNKKFQSLEEAQSFNGLRHLVEFLMTKGDFAYNLAIQFDQLKELEIDQLNILIFCLISYKYYICINVMGICTNQIKYCHQIISNLFPNIINLIEQYSNSDQEDIYAMKENITQCMGYLNRYFRDLQEIVQNSEILKQYDQNFLTSINENDKSFIIYYNWFNYFQQKWLKDKNLQNMNQIQKFLTFETTYTTEKFWQKSPQQIIKIRTNSL